MAVATILLSGCALVNPPQLVTIDAEIPTDFPADGFVHDQFETLLKDYVDADGKVDYERWHDNGYDRTQLDSYLAAVSMFSPDATPERFVRRSDQLAYWLYAYNAYVIKSVLDHWPVESVNDVKAPFEIVKGLGFFYRQRFSFGGTHYSLYVVENDKIRANFRDPRIHFVLNCASASCPVLQPELPTGDDLEPLLQKASVDFVTDNHNVSFDHEKREIVVSTIFKWFKSDFVNDLRRRGIASDNGVIDYIATIAPTELAHELQAAAGYKLVFRDYDWTINSQD